MSEDTVGARVGGWSGEVSMLGAGWGQDEPPRQSHTLQLGSGRWSGPGAVAVGGSASMWRSGRRQMEQSQLRHLYPPKPEGGAGLSF